MQQLKDIARRMGDCHPRTAKRWWKKLDAEQARLKRPRVRPDVRGHGAHKWHDATADLLISLWENYYAAHGTTPEIIRAKYAGDLFDARQFTFNFSTPQNSNVKKLLTKGMGQTIASGKKGGDATAQKARAQETGKRRATAAR